MLLQSKDNPIEIGKMGANTNTTNFTTIVTTVQCNSCCTTPSKVHSLHLY